MAPNSFFDDLMGDFDKIMGQEKPKIDFYTLQKTVPGHFAPTPVLYPTIHELKMERINKMKFESREMMQRAGFRFN
ncbi:unnamed protein product [Bursaphelenchus xylophilus]|uniref:(pine wood nematode) hypothetical protein n=1 Tax=Bursaphelenchus xylophilus TaxID=6326 RepID=A0A1I7RUG1_BURXY|nr:unnamed protein product [Bursaphelenchus xylophilus]CAG9114102.1 unnamed protein product [Bursaphelenchus xylophilus]